MELYSADKIKRKKRKYHTLETYYSNKIITPRLFKSLFREGYSYNIYNGEEKMPFKKRVLEYQKILRAEFE